MNLYLDEISTQVALGATAAVTRDGAGWHQTGGSLKLPSNIVLNLVDPFLRNLKFRKWKSHN